MNIVNYLSSVDLSPLGVCCAVWHRGETCSRRKHHQGFDPRVDKILFWHTLDAYLGKLWFSLSRLYICMTYQQNLVLYHFFSRKNSERAPLFFCYPPPPAVFPIFPFYFPPCIALQGHALFQAQLSYPPSRRRRCMIGCTEPVA